MNQQKYYCKECGRGISEYTNSSNRGMCYSCSQNAYYKENERLTAENAELQATLSKMETVGKELREKLDKIARKRVKKWVLENL